MTFFQSARAAFIGKGNKGNKGNKGKGKALR